MDNQTVEFAVAKENKVITQIGKSTVLQPRPRFKGDFVKWHDDNKLLKRSKA